MTTKQPLIGDQIAVPCTIMRAGTSKGLFFNEAHIPATGPARDRFLKRAMGTPDVLQIDGLGGSRLVTSKVAIVKPSSRSDADVDYTFAQIDIETDFITFAASCGNISAGVGPYAVDEGMVPAIEPITRVRIHNTNTGQFLTALVPVANGKARSTGDFAIAGVPGTGAQILMDYAGTVGVKTGKLLPTGNAVDVISMEDGSTVHATLCDVANPCVFVHSRDVGLLGSVLPIDLMANSNALHRIFEIQGKAGVLFGFWDDWRSGGKPGLPHFVPVAEAGDYVDAAGRSWAAADMHLQSRMVFLGKCHDSMSGTAALCTAAASRVSGSVVQQVIAPVNRSLPNLLIGHPLGIMSVEVEVDASNGDDAAPAIKVLGFGRTARRLMDGMLYLPQSELE